MKNYHIKMSLPEFNGYIHHVVQQGTLDKLLQRYDQEELTLLAEKMITDLERWRDKENMYPGIFVDASALPSEKIITKDYSL